MPTARANVCFSGHSVVVLTFSSSAGDRFCCKRILLIPARKIDSRSSTNKQRRFKNPFVPIRSVEILILQLPRGDFCNKIGQFQTWTARAARSGNSEARRG